MGELLLVGRDSPEHSPGLLLTSADYGYLFIEHMFLENLPGRCCGAFIGDTEKNPTQHNIGMPEPTLG